MVLHLLTGVFGNIPSNPVLAVGAILCMGIGAGIKHLFSRKKK